MDKKGKIFVSMGVVCLLITLFSITVGQEYWQLSGQLIGGICFPIGVLLLIEGTVRRGTEKLTNSEAVYDKIKSMLRSASKFVLLTSGSLNSEAYIHHGKMTEMIKEEAKQGVMFEIIASKNIDRRTLQELTGLFSLPNFNLYLSEENPYPHGLLVDGKELKIEEAHPWGAAERRNIYFKKPTGSMVYFKQCFSQYKQTAHKLTLEEAQT